MNIRVITGRRTRFASAQFRGMRHEIRFSLSQFRRDMPRNSEASISGPPYSLPIFLPLFTPVIGVASAITWLRIFAFANGRVVYHAGELTVEHTTAA